MEPADHRPDDLSQALLLPPEPEAAMEPADHRPDDRSSR